MKKRVTLELDEYAVEMIDRVAKRRLGVGRNAFIALSALRWALEFDLVDPAPKRKIDHKKVHEVIGDMQVRLLKAL